ncbi:MAG: prepilin-type N-terminal cleavage/methylation domain-containing protein [Candidatus Hydrogenedentota bacterium]
MALHCVYRRRCAAASGFTLIELIVALAVVGVASGVMMGLYTASLDLGDRAQDQRIAMSLAQEYLHKILLNPEFYQWELAEAEVEALFAITPVDSQSGGAQDVEPPLTLPALREASVRTRSRYAQFGWEAYGRLPREQAPYFEVTVAVRWRDGGQQRVVTLTSALARARVEGAV